MIFVLERASRSSSRVRRILNAFPRDTHCSYVKKKNKLHFNANINATGRSVVHRVAHGKTADLYINKVTSSTSFTI